MNKNITLLIIDKDRDYAQKLSETAKSHPSFLDAFYICDGSAAFDTLELINPDFVITDFLIPGFDVMGFLRYLKTDYARAKPFVIMEFNSLSNRFLTISGSGLPYISCALL